MRNTVEMQGVDINTPAAEVNVVGKIQVAGCQSAVEQVPINPPKYFDKQTGWEAPV